jgi:hypothetical protein
MIICAPINVNPVGGGGGGGGARGGIWQKYEKTNQIPAGGEESSGQIKVTFPTHGRRATYFKLFKNTNLLTNIEQNRGKSFLIIWIDMNIKVHSHWRRCYNATLFSDFHKQITLILIQLRKNHCKNLCKTALSTTLMRTTLELNFTHHCSCA